MRQQGQRMNGIVENVLGLARREPAKPEHVELMAFARRFVEDYAPATRSNTTPCARPASRRRSIRWSTRASCTRC